MKIGYARTSPAESDADAEMQIKYLRNVGAEIVYCDRGVHALQDRPQLGEALASAGSGDIVLVTKMDRIIGSVNEFVTITDILNSKGAIIRIASIGADTGTALGNFTCHFLATIVEAERDFENFVQRERGVE